MTGDTRLMWGISLVTVPTIIYGGLTVLGVVSDGRMGMPAPQDLTPLQTTFYRAGHAHAGVLLILSLLMQLALDETNLPPSWGWPLRIAAVASVLLVSGGFFATAHVAALRVILYAGALTLIAVTLIVGIGLIRAR
jgi:hypothetical protein